MNDKPKLIKHPNGTKEWHLNGKLHRVDGPAVELSDGSKVWWLNGKCHRVDGPAVEYPRGTKVWYLNGKRHRVDGPAIEHSDGSKEWFLNDEKVDEQTVMEPIKNLTEDEIKEYIKMMNEL